ncbi:hypothetical protein EUGRSUZ_F03191 [Eucalyptus grandis]|uniref:Uncharacterized protein n=2 Tax=Eucalyptus grandis TaxID=71139 RepID=A0ACC3KLI6_EUCGR|nr:hypothetical protein EUGRSUZ_F03191 [Eucalyptus grandis]
MLKSVFTKMQLLFFKISFILHRWIITIDKTSKVDNKPSLQLCLQLHTSSTTYKTLIVQAKISACGERNKANK